MYTARGGVFKSASVSLTVQPSAGAPTVTNWDLRLESRDVSNAPQSVTLAYAPVVVDPPSPPNS